MSCLFSVLVILHLVRLFVVAYRSPCTFLFLPDIVHIANCHRSSFTFLVTFHLVTSTPLIPHFTCHHIPTGTFGIDAIRKSRTWRRFFTTTSSTPSPSIRWIRKWSFRSVTTSASGFGDRNENKRKLRGQVWPQHLQLRKVPGLTTSTLKRMRASEYNAFQMNWMHAIAVNHACHGLFCSHTCSRFANCYKLIYQSLLIEVWRFRSIFTDCLPCLISFR